MQSRHLCSLHVWHAWPGQSRSTFTKSGSNHPDPPRFAATSTETSPTASTWNRWRREFARETVRPGKSEETRRKNEPVPMANRLGNATISRVEGSMLFFRCKRSYCRDGASLLDIEWQFSLVKKRIVAGSAETRKILFKRPVFSPSSPLYFHFSRDFGQRRHI